MQLLACDEHADYCISRIDKLDPESDLAKAFFPLSRARPQLNQVLRVVGYPDIGFWGPKISSTTGPVLWEKGDYYFSNKDGSQMYFQKNVWKLAVSGKEGSSNSPALDANNRIAIFVNTSHTNDTKRSIAELKNLKNLISMIATTSGTEGAVIAKKLWDSNLRPYLCQDEKSLRGCR